MAAVRTIKEGMTYNPDTGNYHVRDAAGNFTGDTTDRDVAERWHASGRLAAMSVHAAVRAVREASSLRQPADWHNPAGPVC
jgi:hypothetical protein